MITGYLADAIGKTPVFFKSPNSIKNVAIRIKLDGFVIDQGGFFVNLLYGTKDIYTKVFEHSYLVPFDENLVNKFYIALKMDYTEITATGAIGISLDDMFNVSNIEPAQGFTVDLAWTEQPMPCQITSCGV